MLEEQGYFVVRSAGSFATDLIAIKIGEIKGFEIKSCGNNVFRLDSRSKEQVKELKELRKYGIEPCFAVRFKQKGVEKFKNWKFFKPEDIENSIWRC